ncbi:hypothetical protein B0H14DRAFT_2579389 [Mycena olivaceomarginata]|nr:hypothetical protein B0H14DRAFT_2579389 [Mycena olivaceomarginata]
MAPSPLEALKQGYKKLKKQVGRRKKALEDRLANKERIHIYNAVVASRDAQQMGEINGGDDDVEDNMGFQPRPPRRQTLSAAQTLRKRQTQLEETNALVTVPITQWFTRTA